MYVKSVTLYKMTSEDIKLNSSLYKKGSYSGPLQSVLINRCFTMDLDILICQNCINYLLFKAIKNFLIHYNFLSGFE